MSLEDVNQAQSLRILQPGDGWSKFVLDAALPCDCITHYQIAINRLSGPRRGASVPGATVPGIHSKHKLSAVPLV